MRRAPQRTDETVPEGVRRINRNAGLTRKTQTQAGTEHGSRVTVLASTHNRVGDSLRGRPTLTVL